MRVGSHRIHGLFFLMYRSSVLATLIELIAALNIETGNLPAIRPCKQFSDYPGVERLDRSEA